MSRAPPVAVASYPGMPAILEAEGPKSFLDSDFEWADPVLAWEAVAVFGGLILADAALLFWTISLPPDRAVSVTPGVQLAVTTGLMFLGTLPSAHWGYTELPLAFAGEAGLGEVVGLFWPLTPLPPGYPLLASLGPYLADLVVLLSFVVAGVAMLVLGVLKSIRAYRADTGDD